MKRMYLLVSLLLLFSIGQNSVAEMPELLQLQSSNSVNQKIVNWRWRAGSDQAIYPYLRVEAEQLFFLNPAGEMIRQIDYLPHSKIVVSQDNGYLGFLENPGNEAMSEPQRLNRQFNYHITDYTGRETYSIPLELSYDDPIPALYLTNDGRSVLVDGYRGGVKILSSNGKLVQQIDLFEDDVLDYEKPSAGAIADDGNMFAILAQKGPMRFDSATASLISGEPHVFCFSFNGKMLLNKPLDNATAAEIAISPSGNLIVVSQYTPDQLKKTSIIDLAGEIMMEIPVLFRYARFTKDQSCLVLADRKTLFKIDVERRSYWSWNLIPESANRMMVDLIVKEEDQSLLILTAESIFQNEQFEFIAPELIQFDQTGEKLWVLEFKQEKFIMPAIFYERNHLGIGFESSCQIYKEQVE